MKQETSALCFIRYYWNSARTLPGQTDVVALLIMSLAELRQKSDDNRMLNKVDLPAFAQPSRYIWPKNRQNKLFEHYFI